jgi:hypothetical protein
MNIYLAQLRFYWTARVWLRRRWFECLRWFFVLRHGLREEALNARSLVDFLRVTVGQFLLAGIAAFALLLSELYLPEYNKFPLWRIADRDTYTTFLASISGIGGIFIGLYYAALTAVGSAIYSKVPNVIRTLLVRERWGTVYMRYLAFVTLLPIFLIGFYELGFSPIRLAVPLMILLSGVGIISFVQLGQRAFYFFDPTRLAYPIFDDLRAWVREAGVGGYRWDDKTFQNHARRQAREALAALGVLADMATEEKHLRTVSLLEISIMLVRFMTEYEELRARIPSDSFWYGRQYKHQEWFYTSDLQTQLASLTGGTLRPEAVADTQWVEDTCLPVLMRALRANIEMGNSELLPSLFVALDGLFDVLGQLGEVGKGFGLIHKITEAVLATFSEGALTDEWYEITDRFATWPTRVLLSYLQSPAIKNYDRATELRRVDWRLASTLYKSGMPPYLLPRLEWMRPRLQFELAVENKFVSPFWYQRELVAQSDAEQFSVNLEEILGASERFYGQWMAHAAVKDHAWLVPFIVNRQKEYLVKLQSNFGTFSRFVDEVEKTRVLGDLRWPTWKIDEWTKTILRLKKLNVRQQAGQAARLTTRARPAALPDFAGEFLHSTAEALIEALVSADDETVKSLVPYYFFASLRKVGDLMPKTGAADWIDSAEARLASGPLSDLVELSGYALLFSDFHGNPKLWSSFRTVWDAYLAKDPSPIAVVVMLIALNETPGMLSARGLVHTNWSTRVGQTLARLPKREVFSGGGFGLHTETIVSHESPLVRALAEGPFFSLYSGTDIFLTLYLFKRPDAAQLRPLISDRGLESSLRHQEHLYAEWKGRVQNEKA